ncbi:MAG: hypothetical protein GY903_08650 [Fuerstiella sp.]|nr:hypothetical protein [Fuerstiella sp.]MCP4854549.1 hypothetical protein [Fuerstiella sp.]
MKQLMPVKYILAVLYIYLLSPEALIAQPVDIGADSRAKAELLDPYMSAIRKIVFVKHSRKRGEHYAYTEALSDAYSNDKERYVKWHAWYPGTSLCLLTVNDDCTTRTEILLDSPNGMIRDPDVSFDGKKILFSWKKSDRNHDYHLFEMDAQSRDIRQLTFDLGHADFEGCYLPNGDIIFSSTRNVSTVDCFVQESCNMFICDKDGKYMRRLGFDQVHTNYPTVMADGRILYTRWEYNDRGQYWPQNLFQMKPDGTAQSALYGNNSWFPTSMLHSRAVPDSNGKVMFIVAGHGTPQSGKLAIVDPTIASEEEAGVTFLAPVRQAANQSKEPNFASKDGNRWRYPYPLDESHCLVSFRHESDTHYSLVFMNADGRYVVLAADPDTSCNHPVLLAARVAAQLPASTVDYRKDTGVFTMENIYHGPGLVNVPKGTIKKLRVVALKYRATVVGGNGNRGPAGGGGVKTPVGARNTSWDAKAILGEARVYSDGSAAFEVPARTPVYFQAIDANGHVAQTMRSWSTLQPGETFSCIGCHVSKFEAPSVAARSIASQRGPQELSPFYDVPADGFSYTKTIQPIWDKRCVSCHNASTTNGIDLSETPRITGRRDRLHYARSYYNLVNRNQTTAEHLDFDGRNDVVTKYLNWLSPQSIPPLLPPYTAGSAKSPLFQMVADHNPPVELSREELDTIACWIDLLVPHDGEYTESMSDDDQAVYRVKLDKRKAWEAVEKANIESYISTRQTQNE